MTQINIYITETLPRLIYSILISGTSTISKSDTNITPQLQTQQPPTQIFDPPFIPPQHATQTLSHTSPQSGSSTYTNLPQNPLTVQFNKTSPTRALPLSIIPNTPAQHTQTQNTQPTLTIKTFQPNPISNYTTFRNITRPPLQTIPTNPLSYNLTSTYPHTTQHSTINNHQLNTLNTPSTSQTPNTTRNPLQSTQFQSSHPYSTTIRTIPHFHNTYTEILSNTQDTTSNASHTPTYNTIPTFTITQSTVSHPTYINSSTSISEPIKPFDGLDHNYTPEERLSNT